MPDDADIGEVHAESEIDNAVNVLLTHIQSMSDWIKEHSDMGAPMAAMVVVKLRKYDDQIAPVAKAMRQLYDHVRVEVVPQAFERDGTRTHTDNDGTRVTVSASLFASIIGGKKDEARKWLREHDYGDLIQETVNASALSGLAREMAQENEELPDGLFNVYIRPSTSITLAK